MVRMINIATLILAFCTACACDSSLARIVAVLATAVSAFSLGLDFAENVE